MLIYHPESDAFFWDPHFEFEGSDGGLCWDATETFWAVVVAHERDGVDIPDYERHLQYLRDMGGSELYHLPIDDDSNPYWNGL